jgi:peptidoglycan/xylan/chitin deacetylase (PgdA/CDA1 family)
MKGESWGRVAARAALSPLGLTPVLGSLRSVKTRKPLVALTFDDGPNPEWTPKFLDVLKANGARGTFFVIGEALEKHREITRRTWEEGHALGNHSWSHPSLPTLSFAAQLEELNRCTAALGGATRLFRPPYGHQSISSRRAARRAGLTVVAWSVQINDWRNQAPAELRDKLRAEMRPGAIVLLHDSIYLQAGEGRKPGLLVDRGPLLEALDTVLAESRDRFEFVTVPELMRRGRPRWVNWYRWKPVPGGANRVPAR